MNKFICDNCGYIEESKEELDDKYICPMCKSKKDKFRLLKKEEYSIEAINAVIDSVVDDILTSDVKRDNIINEVVEDKRIKISEYNNCIMRINEKCINCGQCKKTCESVVGLKYDLNKCKEPICLGCGQCILNCPAGALVPKYEYKEVKSIVDANEKIVVAMISPAVRVSIGEAFGLEPGVNSEKKLVTALKRLGFDYVLDTAFGADLTILEEVAEFAKRLKSKEFLPQFTSCCPSWVRYAEIYHPELIQNISTCKSPIGMQCAIVKEYFAAKKGFDSNNVVTVAVTPCTSKKMEAKEYTLNIDHVITASELSILLHEENINLAELKESEFDSIIGSGSGSGVMFGTTGGVCESVIRTLNRIITNKNLDKDALVFNELRDYNGIKEATVQVGEYKLRVAVVHQMENLEILLENDRYKKYHFIEVMNCKGGCVGGGGQPLGMIPKMDEIKKKRSEGLFAIDKQRVERCAHDNKELKELYKEYLKNPLSDVCERILHTSFSDKSNLLNNKNDK